MKSLKIIIFKIKVKYNHTFILKINNREKILNERDVLKIYFNYIYQGI